MHGSRRRARWRQIDKQNADARQVRQEWMTIMGFNKTSIDELCYGPDDLDLIEELQFLGAAMSNSKPK